MHLFLYKHVINYKKSASIFNMDVFSGVKVHLIDFENARR